MTGKDKLKELFVSELPYEITEEELKQLFSTCGTVRSIFMLKDDRGNFKGIAFIKMATEKENREALNVLDGTKIQERFIKVAPTKPKNIASESVADPAGEQRSRRRREPKGRKRMR